MKFLKQLVHGGLVSLLGFLVIVTIIIFSVVIPLTDQTRTTGWLRDSGAYSNITGSFIEQTRNPQAGEDSIEGQLKDSPVKVETVYESAREAFDADFWQRSVESTLDAFYLWLDGDELKFEINIGEQNTEFMNILEQKTAQQLKGLPACSFSELQNYDVATAKCLPSGVSTAQAAEQFVEQFEAESSPLTDTTITEEDTTISPETEENLRRLYGAASVLPIVLLILLAIVATLAVITGRSRINGLRRVGHVFFIGGISAGIGYFLLTKLIGNASAGNNPSGSGENAILENIIQPLAKTAVNDVAQRGILVSAVVAVVGAAVWAGAYYAHHKHHATVSAPEKNRKDSPQHPASKKAK